MTRVSWALSLVASDSQRYCCSFCSLLITCHDKYMQSHSDIHIIGTSCVFVHQFIVFHSGAGSDAAVDML